MVKRHKSLIPDQSAHCPWCGGLSDAPFEAGDFGQPVQLGPYSCEDCHAVQLDPHIGTSECSDSEYKAGYHFPDRPVEGMVVEADAGSINPIVRGKVFAVMVQSGGDLEESTYKVCISGGTARYKWEDCTPIHTETAEPHRCIKLPEPDVKPPEYGEW